MLKLVRNLMVACAVIIGFVGTPSSADAASAKGKKHEGMRGKIVSISASEIDLQTGGKKNSQTVKVKIDGNTVMVADGNSKPQAGDRVIIVMSGDVAIRVTKVTHPHKKKAAA